MIGLSPVASHGPDGGGRQLERTFPCQEDGSSRHWIGQSGSYRAPSRWPSRSSPQRCRLHLRAPSGRGSGKVPEFELPLSGRSNPLA